MPGQTTNYALPTYEATDAADLTAQYNTAMGLIDSNLKEADDTAIEAAADAAAAQTKANENATAITSLQTQVNELSSAALHQMSPTPF